MMAWRARALTEGSDGLYVEVAKSIAKRNFLVIGPAGSGKLSLVRGLAALIYPRARKFLFDWEVESVAQSKLLLDLSRRVQAHRTQRQIWIQRHLHDLSLGGLRDLMGLISAAPDSVGESVIFCATATRLPADVDSAILIDQLFPFRMKLGDPAESPGVLETFASLAMRSYDTHYRKQISSIEPQAMQRLKAQASTCGLSGMLKLLEQAYAIEEGKRLRESTLDNLTSQGSRSAGCGTRRRMAIGDD